MSRRSKANGNAPVQQPTPPQLHHPQQPQPQKVQVIVMSVDLFAAALRLLQRHPIPWEESNPVVTQLMQLRPQEADLVPQE